MAKQINTRIINKHDTQANWAKATGFIPEKGEILVVDDLTPPGIMVGDGATPASELPMSVMQADWNETDSTSAAYIANKPVNSDGNFIGDITGTAPHAIEADSATKATKLTTARTIGLSDGATGTATSFDGSKNITIPVTEMKEAYLTWGGKDHKASMSPLDAALLPEFGSNRLAYMNPDDIFVEYSNDGGATWQVYNLTNEQKTNLVTTVNTIRIGGGQVSTGTPDQKVRVTLTASNGKLYCTAKKILIDYHGNGAAGGYVDIERAPIGSPDIFVAYKTVQLGGDSAWNIIQTNFLFGGSNSQTEQTRKLRLTFGITGTSYGSALAGIKSIYLVSSDSWALPSNMSKYGRLYGIDGNQNATFPAKISAVELSTSGSVEIEGALLLPNASNTPETEKITDTYSFRVTANKNITNLTTVDGALTTIQEIAGNSIIDEEEGIKHAEIERIESFGPNLFDASKIKASNIKVNYDGSEIFMPLATSGNGYTSTGAKLYELCPELRVGDTAYLNFSESKPTGMRYFYLSASKGTWYGVNGKKTITQDDLNSTVIFYANNVTNGYTEKTSFLDFRITREPNAPFVPYTKDVYEPIGGLTLGIYDTLNPEQKILTRRTSSYILTGTETWTTGSGAAEGANVYACNVIDSNAKSSGRGICDRYDYDLTKATNTWGIYGGSYYLVFCVSTSDYPTLSSWTQYLKDQYAAGTPVSIIYETKPVEETVEVPLGYTAYNSGTEQIIGNGVLPTITQTYSIHENPTEACTKGYVNNGLAKKLDKVGGTITGSLIVEGSTDTDLSALVVKNSDATYGLTYEGDAFKLGLGSVDDNNDFTFDEGEGSPIALRADSSTFTDGHMVVWSTDGNKLVDGGPAGSDIVYSPNGTMLSQKLDGDGSFEFVNEPANITSKQFTEATRVGAYSVTLGGKSAATGKRALAEGTSTWAEGNYSHAEGNKSYAKGAQSHAEGAQTYAFGDQSHAEGWKTYANGSSSHAEGAGSFAIGKNAHAEGQDGHAYGTAAHAEGNNVTVYGDYAHGEGDETYTQGAAAHAEGRSTRAEANYAHAEGFSSHATNTSAHAEGQGSNASGEASHAEGIFTVASGYAAHAEGNRTEAIHDNSHAAGAYTRTSRQNQTVVGQANKDDENALFIVGNGYYEWPSFSSTNPAESSRKNAFAVMASSEPTIKVGSTTLTEAELQQMKSSGGTQMITARIEKGVLIVS